MLTFFFKIGNIYSFHSQCALNHLASIQTLSLLLLLVGCFSIMFLY